MVLAKSAIGSNHKRGLDFLIIENLEFLHGDTRVMEHDLLGITET